VGQKLKYVLSDLHIGLDRAHQPAQDIAASQQFVQFLHAIWRESERNDQEIELIINGDFLALLQAPAVDVYLPSLAYPAPAYLDSSQEASVKRLKLIAERNPDVFNALSDFIHVENPQRRITIIKGNHDVTLYWPGVKNRLREILGAFGTRASLLRFADEFVSREKIYVEHGHQRAEKMNGYNDSFDPRAIDNPSQIHYPTGALFTINFLNEARRRWWFVDHLKPVTSLIWYAFQWNFDFACQALASFIRHTPALVVSDMPISDNAIIPADTLLQDLEDDAVRRRLAKKYAASAEFRLEFHRRVQQYIEDAIIDNKGEAAFSAVTISSDPLDMGRADQLRQRSMLQQAALGLADPDKARVIVFGHTHHPVWQELPQGCVYVNTGSWSKDLANAAPETWAALFAGAIQPADIPFTLPYARIEYDENDNPTAQLLYFNPTPPEAGP